MRHFAFSKNGKKTIKNIGTVNKNEVKSLNRQDPSLTIYPFSLDDLKEPKILSHANDECKTKHTEMQKTEDAKVKEIQPETILIVKYILHMRMNAFWFRWCHTFYKKFEY